MVTKKIRSEYMHKFLDPSWDVYAKSYEDSLRYRLTRRLLEHAHKPWFWEDWERKSEVSGTSTPKMGQIQAEGNTSSAQMQDGASGARAHLEEHEGEGKIKSAESAMQCDATPHTDSRPKRSHRLRTSCSEPDRATFDKALKRPPRAKSQPAWDSSLKSSNSEHVQLYPIYGWPEPQTENVVHTGKARLLASRSTTRWALDEQARRPDRRRARSADLEKMHKTKVSAAEDTWVTEYMRSFSTRCR